MHRGHHSVFTLCRISSTYNIWILLKDTNSAAGGWDRTADLLIHSWSSRPWATVTHSCSVPKDLNLLQRLSTARKLIYTPRCWAQVHTQWLSVSYFSAVSKWKTHGHQHETRATAKSPPGCKVLNIPKQSTVKQTAGRHQEVLTAEADKQSRMFWHLLIIYAILRENKSIICLFVLVVWQHGLSKLQLSLMDYFTVTCQLWLLENVKYRQIYHFQLGYLLQWWHSSFTHSVCSEGSEKLHLNISNNTVIYSLMIKKTW